MIAKKNFNNNKKHNYSDTISKTRSGITGYQLHSVDNIYVIHMYIL